MMPILLICCEGKTEQQYFRILRRNYRLPGAQVVIIGEKGQHKSLIDRTVQEQHKLCEEYKVLPEEIECWAVCDDDGMTSRYADLLSYAEEKMVHLAFSRPQFEAFLLQHFEQSGEHHPVAIFEKLSTHKMKYDGAPYDSSSKADLAWLETAIDTKPKLIDIALVNADQRQRQAEKLFLTVQCLVKRMKDLGK